MKIDIVSQDKKAGKLVFKLSESDSAFANMLRKTILDEVPTMAIDIVEFRQNSSVLYDEIIAHRLGLLPLKTDLKAYNLKDECTCGGAGCSKCELMLMLKTKTNCVVYASDMESKDPKIVPVFPETPIVKLLKNQNLEFEATACLGRGKEHAKWSPCLVHFTNEPDITINNSSPKLKEFKDKFPPQALDKSGKIDKKKIIELNLADACDGICDDIVKVKYNDNNFLFYVESWGQLPAKDIVEEAVKIIKQKLDDLAKKMD